MRVATLARVTGPVCVREEDLEWQSYPSQIREGIMTKHLRFFDEDRGANLKIASIYAKPPFYSPRHRHTYAQVRYIISGQIDYGKETYSAGDCIFIPESLRYGPMQPSTTSLDETCHFVDMQYSGPAGTEYLDPDRYSDAVAELSKSGTFDKGIYRPHEGQPIDAYEAIHLHLTGSKPEYPPARLQDYVVVHSEAIPWQAHGDGIEVKYIASFFETGPRLSIAKLAKGAVLPGGTSPCQQSRYLVHGSIDWAGDSFDALSLMYYPQGDEYPSTRCLSDSATVVVSQWVNRGHILPAAEL